MKRFIIISLLAVMAVRTQACIWIDNYNYYLFSPFPTESFRSRVDKITLENWRVYLGSDEQYYYFQADEVCKFAQQKGDVLMVSYVRNLQKYLDCADQKRSEQWDYPTKEQIAKRKQTLQNVRAYAQGKLKSRLRSQHALLFMRCNMMLDRHDENIRFWEQTASQYIETVYRDMMRNIYAGALLKKGRGDEAGRIFAEQGDFESLMTQFYERRSYQAIRQEYLRDPNSAVLPFLLKDFVNNSQEAVDAINDPDGLGGKLFIRNISESEARQMIGLAGQVVSEGKTQTPVLWQSAKARLEYLFGDRKQAATDILAATKMEGTPRMKDNARVLMLYITSSQAPMSETFDDYLAGELEWIDDKLNNDEFYRGALDRLTHQVLAEKYAHRAATAVALLKATDCSLYSNLIDTMSIENLIQYIDYVRSPAQTALDKFLKARQDADMNFLNDMAGTKYLRLCRWAEAQEWLQKVSLPYYNDRGYAIYAAKRRWNVEPWITRQWLKEGEEYSGAKQYLQSNPKMDFAREMQAMESKLNLLSGKARQQQCFDLAVRYAQAHFTGDCWFLMRDGKSISDTLRTNETDLAQRTLELLREVSLTTDFTLKERALYAMSYGYLYPERLGWAVSEWDSKQMDYVKRVNLQSPQFKAFAALTDLEKANATRTSRYVSRCDEYIQFRKTYR